MNYQYHINIEEGNFIMQDKNISYYKGKTETKYSLVDIKNELAKFLQLDNLNYFWVQDVPAILRMICSVLYQGCPIYIKLFLKNILNLRLLE